MASYPFSASSARAEGAHSPMRSYSPSTTQPLMSGAAPMGYRPSFDERAGSPYLVPPSPGLSQYGSSESLHENPFHGSDAEHSISNKFNLAPDPRSWGAELSPDFPESDDYLHSPDKRDTRGSIFTARGAMNLGCLFILVATLVSLFAGYPIVSWILTKPASTLGGFNLGGINATGQVTQTMFSLIDAATPQEAMTYTSTEDGTEWQLVFSDEFETPGRTFYPGDDPFWEAVNLHYWQTNNLEWYSPDSLTTVGGHLQITLSAQPNHGLNYMGGMMSSWNKFCFTGGIIVTSVVLPGKSDVYGLWPAVWTMGNLGRAGYGASLDGMWPYTYEACDLGTLANQTLNGAPLAATTTGDPNFNGELSYLPGQRLSACTCPGESHPGPQNSDGTFNGRSAPEVDIFEALVTVDTLIGQVSQSAQWAPFNAYYTYDNATYTTIYNSTATALNAYKGSVYQQASSAISTTNQNCYEGDSGCYSTYGFEYKPGYDSDGGYITWINGGNKAWRLAAGGMGADTVSEISARPVPKEPMYIIANLGMSENFGQIDFTDLVFPVHMLVDWIRVYQNPQNINIGCDPPDFPTNNYIEQYIEAYTNPNLTTWVNSYGQTIPKNKLIDNC